jgi:acetylornithine/N-succinyldiaminopimelate aminotransferase
MTERGESARWRVIACHGAFHGRSLTAISAAGSEKMLAGFGPPVAGFDHVPFNDPAAVEAAITTETAAILVEPVQGEGGIRPASLSTLRELRAIADRHGVYLIFDEIQCGMGHTGRLFAHEWAGITPDIMAVAKGIGTGFPLGACLTTAEAGAAMGAGSHGSTYGGNPLAMAVGNAVLDVMLSEGFLDGVDRVARDLWFKLLDLRARHPDAIAEVRGAGLMLGLKCQVSNADMVAELRRQGLLTVPAGDNVVRLLPPLIIGEAEVDEALDKLGRACARLAGPALAGEAAA